MTDYPSSLIVRPLTTWPGKLTPGYDRRRSPFSATMRSTITTLSRELGCLAATDAVLEVAIPEGQFRIDGRPRATARAEHPGVVLSLPNTNVGPLRYAVDAFTTWQDNLRAIALALEALRRVERYGVVRRAEQYAGFRAIESAGRGPTSYAEALAFVSEHSGLADFDRADLDRAYRLAVRKLHPDAGGSAADFQRLGEAMEILRQETRPC